MRWKAARWFCHASRNRSAPGPVQTEPTLAASRSRVAIVARTWSACWVNWAAMVCISAGSPPSKL